MDFRIEWPAPMDEYDWAIQEDKGWLDVLVARNGGRRVVEVYDPVRLAQSVTSEVGRLGRFTAGSLLVVPSVTRENIESAISAIADEGFFDQMRCGGTPEASSH
ncbi:hypothetical protein OG539_34340 [Actinacidiphila glaucinigra]|uniref:hypothetical protein n=1 Tax=Actinacidiphila glaucinigra TaxID=235986 RepID=UPI002DD82BC0|nr:hypothetical protein [Actinacidiphila glaucinigra]WSD59034.1 hypothetical protein OIE69_08975 [Actinacidiphila glaucinigra]